MPFSHRFSNEKNAKSLRSTFDQLCHECFLPLVVYRSAKQSFAGLTTQAALVTSPTLKQVHTVWRASVPLMAILC